jgi:hypothetical protein
VEQFLKPLFPPAAASPSQPEFRELLTAACNGGLRPGAAQTACKACPAGSGLFEVGDSEVQAVTLGRFTDPSTDSAVLSMGGCESHSLHFGGTVVLEKRADVWRKLRYLPGIITTDCHRLEPHQGRELLLCTHHFGSNGMISRSLFTLEFDLSGQALSSTLLTVWNSAATCGRSADGEHLESVQQDLIQSVSFPDLNGDGVPDLSVRIRSTSSKPTAVQAEACWQRILSRSSQPLSMPVNAPVYRLYFLRRGARFDPTPATRQILPRFKD